MELGHILYNGSDTRCEEKVQEVQEEQAGLVRSGRFRYPLPLFGSGTRGHKLSATYLKGS